MNRVRRCLPETCIFLALLFCYAYFPPRWADWNQNSRMDLTLAIVDQGRLAIDDYYGNTGDYALYGGHVYTDKAPGVSMLGVPVYAAFRLALRLPALETLVGRLSRSDALQATLREGGSGLQEDKVRFAAALYAVTLSVVSLPSALLGALLYRFLGRIVAGPLWRAALALGYGLATIALPYSSLFYGHQVAAVLFFSAFYLTYRVRLGELGTNWLWGSGALAGLMVLAELPTLAGAALLGAYVLVFLHRRDGARGALAGAARFVAGGLPFALLLGAYNASCFGSPLASGYRYLGRFPEIADTGLLGFGLPRAQALFGVTFSPQRGLFVFSPFLLWAVPGFLAFAREREWRPEAALSAGAVAVHLLLVSCWTDWQGGFAIGPRNLLPVLPFFVVAIGFLLRRPANRFVGWGLALSLAISFAVTWVASTAGQDLAPLSVANPLVDFFWPRLAAGDVTRNLGMAVGLRSWWSLLPPILFVGGASGGLAWTSRSQAGPAAC